MSFVSMAAGLVGLALLFGGPPTWFWSGFLSLFGVVLGGLAFRSMKQRPRRGSPAALVGVIAGLTTYALGLLYALLVAFFVRAFDFH